MKIIEGQDYVAETMNIIWSVYYVTAQSEIIANERIIQTNILYKNTILQC